MILSDSEQCDVVMIVNLRKSFRPIRSDLSKTCFESWIDQSLGSLRPGHEECSFSMCFGGMSIIFTEFSRVN